MADNYYNLPMIRENFVSRNIKKLFQGFFNIRRKKRDQKRAQILAQRARRGKVTNTESVAMQGSRQRVDIYEFQEMYKRGEIPVENMNEDQKYALIKLFEMQNERIRESIQEHKKNTEIYNAEVERLKRELEIIG